MEKNKILLHNENGITALKIDDTEIRNVKDYKVVSSANGKTELTFTIVADDFITDFEAVLVGN